MYVCIYTYIQIFANWKYFVFTGFNNLFVVVTIQHINSLTITTKRITLFTLIFGWWG